MPRFEVELEDGRKFEVEADSQPSESEIMDAIGTRDKAVNAPQYEPEGMPEKDTRSVSVSSPIGVPWNVELPIDPSQSVAPIPRAEPEKQTGTVTLSSPIGVPWELDKDTMTKAGAAVLNTAASVPNFMLSPVGTATMPIGGTALGKAAIQGVFAGLSAKGGAEALGEASVTGDTQKAMEGALMLGLAPTMATPSIHPKVAGALTPKPKPQWQGPIATGEILKRSAAVLPESTKAVIETLGPEEAAKISEAMTQRATAALEQVEQAKPSEVSNAAQPERESLRLADNVTAEIYPQIGDVFYLNNKGERIGSLETVDGPNGELMVENHYIDPEIRGSGFGGKAIQRLSEITGKTIVSDVNPSESARAMWDRLGAKPEQFEIGEGDYKETQTRYVLRPKEKTNANEERIEPKSRVTEYQQTSEGRVSTTPSGSDSVKPEATVPNAAQGQERVLLEQPAPTLPAPETGKSAETATSTTSEIVVGGRSLPVKGKLKPNTLYVWGADWHGHTRSEVLKTAKHSGDLKSALSNFKQTNPTVAPQVIMATDSKGKPSKVLSPNGDRILPFGSAEANYMAGDVNAFRKDSLKRYEEALARNDVESANAAISERIAEAEKLADEQAKAALRIEAEYKDAQAKEKAGVSVKTVDDRFETWKHYLSNLKTTGEWNLKNEAQYRAEAESWRSKLVKTAEPPPTLPTPETAKAKEPWKGKIQYETFDEPRGEWQPETKDVVVSKSTIPGDKPWRATVFSGSGDSLVAIGHVQLDSPSLTPEALSALSEQLGRYTRKIRVEKQIEKSAKSTPTLPTPETAKPTQPAAAKGEQQGSVVRIGQVGVEGDLFSKANHAYRGMTEAEFKATLGKGKGVASRGDFRAKEEGTNFAAKFPDAESYINFGRDDPRKTGKPTYIVEVNANNLKKTRRGDFESFREAQPTRIWRIDPVKDTLVATEIRLENAKRTPPSKNVGGIPKSSSGGQLQGSPESQKVVGQLYQPETTRISEPIVPQDVLKPAPKAESPPPVTGETPQQAALPATASEGSAKPGVSAPAPSAISNAKPIEQKTQAQEIVGMGGAVPSEFELSPHTPTSIKNAVVDQEITKRGLRATMASARKEFQGIWDKAMAIIDRDPAIQDRLIAELKNQPRPLRGEENAMLLHRQIDLQNEYGKATRDMAQAYDDGRLDAVSEIKLRVDALSDALQEIYDIGKSVGTENAIGLVTRKMMAYEDFTLANIQTEARAAKGGKPLTEAERKWLENVQKREEETRLAYEKHIQAAEAKRIELEQKLAMAEAAKGAASEPKYPEVILKIAERIVSTLDTKADAARIRLREKMGRVSSGVDPTILLDLTEIGASHIAHIGLDFAKWSTEMVKELGEWVKPELEQVFKMAQSNIDAYAIPEKIKAAVKKLTPEEAKKDFAKTIRENIENKQKGKVKYYVDRLARILYSEGITEREAMVTALHDIVKQELPDVTRSEVGRIFAGYGDYRQLSKEHIAVELRKMRGELMEIAKLEDMEAGKPPLKSGHERGEISEARRQLIKLVNDAKNKFQIPIQDPNTQLKSALDTLKTTLRNRTLDYQDRIARKDFNPRLRREVVLDKEAMRLKAENELVKKRYYQELEKWRLSQRVGWQRMADTFVKWERAFKLSSPVVFGKLFAAALTRIGTTAAEEVVGGIQSHLPGISRIAKQAPREGGINVRGMAKAMAEAITIGIRDAKQTAKTGLTDLDTVLGGKIRLDSDWHNIFGQLHGMMKAPIKRAEYTLSLEKRLAHNIKNGVDVTDPMVQTRIMVEALDDGYRSIFMQRGFTSDMFTTLVSMMAKSKKYPVAGYISSRALRFLLPIIRVPTNIVSETFTGAHGTITASARTMFHAINGTLDTLPPQVADSIMRQFKKGSIGLALMAIGYFNPQFAGGYDWREKRKKGEVKTGGFRIDGWDVPRWMTHAPWFELMQFGATIRHVKSQHVKGQDKGIGEGAWAAGFGLIEETPFVGEMARATQAMEGESRRTKFLGEMAQSTIVPQAISKIASMDDPLAESQRRAPKTIWQYIKTGIPILRETVPTKPVK